MSAKGICDKSQYAFGGKCVFCPDGQESLDFLSCKICAAGKVRGNEFGAGSGGCVSPKGICNNSQKASGGKCVFCPDGQESLDFLTCKTCVAGKVRGNEYGAGSGGCVSPKGICNISQKASGGKCVYCPDGQESLDFLTCKTCVAGKVRGNEYGTGSGGCVSAKGICASTQIAQGGKCVDCTAPLTPNAGLTKCI